MPGVGARARRAVGPGARLLAAPARRPAGRRRGHVGRRRPARAATTARCVLFLRERRAAAAAACCARAATGPTATEHERLREVLPHAGRVLLPRARGAATTACTLDALWDLVWAGEVTNDTFAPVRALSAKQRAGRQGAGRPAAARRRSARSARPRPRAGGRWSTAVGGRRRAHRAAPRAGRRAARAPRRADPRGGAGRGRARRVRRRVPGAAGHGGGGPHPARLLRRRPRRRPVRPARRGRPPARRRDAGPRPSGPSCWPPPTPPTPTACRVAWPAPKAPAAGGRRLRRAGRRAGRRCTSRRAAGASSPCASSTARGRTTAVAALERAARRGPVPAHLGRARPTRARARSSATRLRAHAQGAGSLCLRATPSSGPRGSSTSGSRAAQVTGAAASVRVPAERLVGDEVDAVEARAKHLLIRFAAGSRLHTHMRMTGVVARLPARARRGGSPSSRRAWCWSAATAWPCASTRRSSSCSPTTDRARAPDPRRPRPRRARSRRSTSTRCAGGADEQPADVADRRPAARPAGRVRHRQHLALRGAVRLRRQPVDAALEARGRGARCAGHDGGQAHGGQRVASPAGLRAGGACVPPLPGHNRGAAGR